MSCLKNLTRSVFLTIVVVGFVAFGGQQWIQDAYNNFMHPTHDTIIERAKKVGDFSRINKEFEIEKAAGILGYNAVLAQNKATGQKMLVIDSNKKPIITKEDITAQDSEERIKRAISKFKYQYAALEDFRITERGTMYSYGKEVPYVKFNAKLKKLPMGDISGIISVAQDEKGNEKVLVSANQAGRYSQVISNEFFKEIK